MANLYDFKVKSIRGDDCALSNFEGKVCLVVNVASACGLAPQYDGLQRLYAEYKSQGLEILAFPCNQFGAQEPGTDSEIATFCEANFRVEFPMFSKLEVNGEGRDPLFAWLTGIEVGPAHAGDVAWNFAKFLVGRDGNLMARFEPQTEPCSAPIKQKIEAELG